MSEGMEIEVEDAIRAWKAALAAEEGARRAMDAAIGRERTAGLVLARAEWALIERLAALEESDPGARTRVGDTVYWLEDACIRSEPADHR